MTTKIMYNNLPIKVEVGVSEPWDFDGTKSGGFIGEITHILVEKYYSIAGEKTEEQALFVVSKPFVYEGMKCKYFIVSPRHEGFSFADLIAGNSLNLGMVRVPTIHGESDNPLKYRANGKEKTSYIIGTMKII